MADFRASAGRKSSQVTRTDKLPCVIRGLAVASDSQNAWARRAPRRPAQAPQHSLTPFGEQYLFLRFVHSDRANCRLASDEGKKKLFCSAPGRSLMS